jgi:hypothetical protein
METKCVYHEVEIFKYYSNKFLALKGRWEASVSATAWHTVASTHNWCANFNVVKHLMIKHSHRSTASIALKRYGPQANINLPLVCMISGFRRGENQILALLGCYAPYVGIYLPTFRNNLLVSPSTVNQSKKMLVIIYITDIRTQQICALLGYSSAYSGNSVPTFRDNLSVLSSRTEIVCLTLEDRADRLFPNVGTELPLHAA